MNTVLPCPVIAPNPSIFLQRCDNIPISHPSPPLKSGPAKGKRDAILRDIFCNFFHFLPHPNPPLSSRVPIPFLIFPSSWFRRPQTPYRSGYSVSFPFHPIYYIWCPFRFTPQHIVCRLMDSPINHNILYLSFHLIPYIVVLLFLGMNLLSSIYPLFASFFLAIPIKPSHPPALVFIESSLRISPYGIPKIFPIITDKDLALLCS